MEIWHCTICNNRFEGSNKNNAYQRHHKTNTHTCSNKHKYIKDKNNLFSDDRKYYFCFPYALGQLVTFNF